MFETRESRSGYKRCKCCGASMTGVIDYKIREHCHDCGGASLIDTGERREAVIEAFVRFGVPIPSRLLSSADLPDPPAAGTA